MPTYQERENIPLLIARIDALRLAEDLDVELIFMDDNSRDGSAEYVRDCGHDWVRLIERTGPRGLSPDQPGLPPPPPAPGQPPPVLG